MDTDKNAYSDDDVARNLKDYPQNAPMWAIAGGLHRIAEALGATAAQRPGPQPEHDLAAMLAVPTAIRDETVKAYGRFRDGLTAKISEWMEEFEGTTSNAPTGDRKTAGTAKAAAPPTVMPELSEDATNALRTWPLMRETSDPAIIAELTAAGLMERSPSMTPCLTIEGEALQGSLRTTRNLDRARSTLSKSAADAIMRWPESLAATHGSVWVELLDGPFVTTDANQQPMLTKTGWDLRNTLKAEAAA